MSALSESRPGREGPKSIDLGVKNEKITAGLKAFDPTIARVVGGVAALLPDDVRVDTATFDPRAIVSTNPAKQFPTSGYVQTITFGGDKHPSGADTRVDVVPHLATDPRAIIPQVRVALIPDRVTGETSTEAYSATGKPLELEVSARISSAQGSLSEAERTHAAEAGLLVKDNGPEKELVDVSFRLRQGEPADPKVDALLAILDPHYGDPYTHVFLARQPQEVVSLNGRLPQPEEVILLDNDSH